MCIVLSLGCCVAECAGGDAVQHFSRHTCIDTETVDRRLDGLLNPRGFVCRTCRDVAEGDDRLAHAVDHRYYADAGDGCKVSVLIDLVCSGCSLSAGDRHAHAESDSRVALGSGHHDFFVIAARSQGYDSSRCHEAFHEKISHKCYLNVWLNNKVIWFSIHHSSYPFVETRQAASLHCVIIVAATRQTIMQWCGRHHCSKRILRSTSRMLRSASLSPRAAALRQQSKARSHCSAV